MRNVIVVPHLVGEFKTEGRPLYFSMRVARNWVDAQDAEWVGNSKKRILLTEKGQQRLVEMEAIRSMRGRSHRLGMGLAEAYRNAEPWAAVLVGQIRDRRLRSTSSAGGGAGNSALATDVSRVHRSVRVLNGKEGCNAS